MAQNSKMLDRELYRKVKAMDKAQLEGFIQRIYKSGVEDAGTSAVTMEQIKEAIRTVPGIGEKRLEQIVNALKPLFARETSGEAENEK